MKAAISLSAGKTQAWYFALTIFLSAFLLFQVQPMISKYILPWFGGGPAVWTAAMMFFQVLLLGGYAYAHTLSRVKLASQGKLHLIVLALVLSYLVLMAFTWATPITPDASWKPTGVEFPVAHVVLVLGISVGLPYFLLSTTSSLAQAWFSRLHSQSSPYSFYILSNAASFLALLSYPILVEPNWTVHQQAGFWSAGFVVYLFLVGFCAVQVVRGDASQAVKATQTAGNEEVGTPPSRRFFLLWIALAACASVMLLATTNQMCLDIASIPFLWVLPLSLYLLSFIFAFTDRIARYRGLIVGLTIIAIFIGLWSMAYGSQSSILSQIAANSFLLFIICIFCHSELYRLRPHPRYLTSFYLALSIGGALGGVFVSLIAPVIFKDFWEYPLGLIFCAFVVTAISYQSRGTWINRLRIPISVTALTLAALILLLPILWVTKTEAMYRNFYGVIKIRASEIAGFPGFDMMHGAIVHGSQASTPPESLRPTRYFTENSGIGLAIINHPRRLADKPLRVGIIGLGVGTLAAYGEEGDTFRFFEIDPAVIEIAQDTRYFTYLSQSNARVEVVAGDGRLSLEKEQKNGDAQYDILVIDAFSGDSIPTHLVSSEAVELYLSLLKEDGLIGFHITNRHLNLEPVLARAAESLDLEAAVVQTKAADDFGADSTWVLVSRDPALLASPALAKAKRSPVANPAIRLWTDDFSNLFQVLW